MGNSRPRRRRTMLLAAGAAPATALFMIPLVVGGDPAPVTSPVATGSFENGLVLTDRAGALPGGRVGAIGEPCRGAVHVSPQLLTSGVTIDSFSTQALLPDRSVARPTDAWTCWSGRSNPTVIFDEVVVLYDPSWGEANTALAFRRAMQQRVGSEIVDIDGHAAFVDHGSEKTPIGTLLTVVDGVMVSMYNTADADGHSLLRFASSLVEANS